MDLKDQAEPKACRLINKYLEVAIFQVLALA